LELQNTDDVWEDCNWMMESKLDTKVKKTFIEKVTRKSPQL
jgi:hypothetical protein